MSGWLLIVISSSLSEAPWTAQDVPVEISETPLWFDQSGPEVTCTAGVYRAQRRERSQSFPSSEYSGPLRRQSAWAIPLRRQSVWVTTPLGPLRR